MQQRDGQMKPFRFLHLMIALSVLAICGNPPERAVAFYPNEHQRLAIFAFEILRELYPETFIQCIQLKGEDPLIRNMIYENISYVPDKPSSNAELVDRVAWEALAPDCYRDLEFVDVDLGRDDPHENTILENSDEATYSTKDDPLVGTLYELFGLVHSNFTAFNHFINIGSYGNSKFDDYGGYSYQFVKEYGNQYESDKKLFGMALDDGIIQYYSDEYVHAPGQQWYRDCSPSVKRYSFPRKYPTTLEELKARFPLAKCVRCENCGVPYSVFPPVDNMARYWHSRFLETKDPLDLGPVMHAIGDASIPHHTAGYLGNWHQYYETRIADDVLTVINSAAEKIEIKALISSWDRMDHDIPESLAPKDYMKTPAINWSVENLVTWLALNAYRQYKNDYEPYYRSKGDKIIYHDKAKELIRLATAMKVLVLKKALSED
jgi:hypothetical protein